jgi:DNA-binding transcriptional LysR family regulator
MTYPSHSYLVKCTCQDFTRTRTPKARGRVAVVQEFTVCRTWLAALLQVFMDDYPTVRDWIVSLRLAV